ncbi:MAG: hypothetical protein ACX93O_03970 [Flagellimonas sp.]
MAIAPPKPMSVAPLNKLVYMDTSPFPASAESVIGPVSDSFENLEAT